MAPSANPRILVFVRTGCLFAKSQKTRKQALIVRPMVFDSGCFRHAADTAPLEGLPILRCAIYDPLEGLQISKMRLAEMGV